MSAWIWLGLACLIAFGTKVLGFLVPETLLDSPAIRNGSAAATVGLLTALVMANTFGSGQQLVLDARVVALVAAAIALVLRVPFIGVVVVGTVAAALARLAGMA
ncbi:AzlD domain-containing protein [Mobilicoccus massiliensis]|uniref:AzlD domain-containing protein n=1 Tax=Mobilicoccus massiliensis TaxID=1522310 RepID=UPI00058C50B2|nr:AzlD domain-containing protein [Mobilicoccus massiliensis]